MLLSSEGDIESDHELNRSRTAVVSSLRKQRLNLRNERNDKPLSATDVLAPTTMKNAAKCDTSCELQNPVSHQNFERNLHFPREVCLLECLFYPHHPPSG